MRTFKLLFLLLFASTIPASAQTFDVSCYADNGTNSMCIFGSSTQKLTENLNIDLTSVFGCKLQINIHDQVEIPNPYNQTDFLKRKLNTCSWTVNQCGIDPKCDSSVVQLPDAKYYRQQQYDVCAVTKIGTGSSETPPDCYHEVRPFAFRNKPNAGAELGVSINVSPPK
jgi:hypothetical protein